MSNPKHLTAMEKKKKKLEHIRLDLLKMPREEQDRYRRDLSDAASFLNSQKRKEEIAREEGKEEEKKKIVLEMKANLIPIEVISKCTGLTPDQIAKL